MATRMQQRRGTAAQWTGANPILAVGELGFETDTGKFKIGDGTNHWADLSYFQNMDDLGGSFDDYIPLTQKGQANGVAQLDATGNVPFSQLGNIIDGAPGVLDTLNEIAAAINDDPTFFTSVATNLSNHEADTTNVHGIANTAELATKTFAAELLTNATKTNITITGDKNGLTITAENGVADSTTDNLSEGTTNLYFTDERAQDAVGNNVGNGLSYNDASGSISVTPNTYDIYGAASQAQTAAEGTASTALSLHNLDTSNVHGITDTLDLATKSGSNYFTGANNTFTGNVIVEGAISAGTDLTVNGNLTVNGTTTTISAAELSVTDNMIYLNESPEFSVTNAVGDGTNVTYTVGDHNLTTSMVSKVSGITPSSLNISSYSAIVSVTATTITIANSSTDTYTSGGTLTASSGVNPDLGIVGAYNDGTYAHAGIVRDASDNGTFKFFAGYVPEPGQSIDFTQATLSPVKALSVTVTDVNADNVTTDTFLANSASIGSVSNTEIQYLVGLQSSVQTQLDSKASTQSLTDHANDTTAVHGISDTANLVYLNQLDVFALDTDLSSHAGSASTHGVTGNIVGTTDTQTLENKSISLGSNTISGTIAQFNTAVSDADLATLAGTETLTNKTISAANNTLTIATTDLTGVTVSAAELNILDGATLSTTELNYVDGVTSAIQTQLDAKALSSDLSSHASDTTSIHGISDTAQLAYLNAANQTFTGNMEVDGNVVVDGNLTVNGTTFNASATSITIEDNMLQLAHQNSANTVDLGVVVAYNDGSAKHAGIVRDVSDAKWKLFKDVSTEPSTTVAFTEGSLDNLALNNVEVAGVVFTDGTQTKEGVPSRTTILQKTANYTLSSADERDELLEMGSASAVTVTIPADSTVNFPIGTSLDVLQTGAGQVTIAGAVGVTVNATPGLKLRAQWSSATLFKRAANTWVVMGDLSA